MQRVIVVLCAAAMGLGRAQIGRLDTVGCTVSDWQLGAPALRRLCNAPDYGLHVVWAHSESTSPDWNAGYNFYDYQTNSWSWAGIVFPYRAILGNLDCDPRTGVAVMPAFFGTPIRLVLARDVAPGSGLFEYCEGPEGFYTPVAAVDSGSWSHVAAIDDASRSQVWHARCTTWCQWCNPVHVPPPEPDPEYPDQNIAASKVSRRVAVVWVYSPDGYSQKPGYYRVSNDGGNTWEQATQLPYPPAFGGETLPSFSISSLFPYFDRQDRFHIVAAVVPFYHDTNYIMPAEIWHWSETSAPSWARIHRAGCDPRNLAGSVGYNALFAGRPTIGEDRLGGLYVAWEQFDSLNLEPLTNRLRADVFSGRDNYDNGASWNPAVKMTVPDSTSKRFPCVVDLLARDTLCVTYMVDLVAGFFVYGEGPATRNPIVVQFVPGLVGGIESEAGRLRPGPRLSLWPNPSRSKVRLDYDVPVCGPVELGLFDMSGRQVALLFSSFLTAGRHSVEVRLQGLPGGVYLLQLRAGRSVATRRLVRLD